MERNELIEYIKTLNAGDLAYQLPDRLLSVLGQQMDDDTNIQEEKEIIFDIIRRAKHVRQVDLNFAEEFKCYRDLTEWSHEEDALIMADEDLLLNLGTLAN